MNQESPEVRPSYEVESVRRSEPPSGMEGADWYRYVIAFGGSRNIQGYRQGKLGAVTEAVEGIVAQMNERHRGKRGRVHLVPAKKKATQVPDQAS